MGVLVFWVYSSQGKMSLEHDSSDEGSIEGSAPVPDNGQIGEKRGRPLGKKKKRPPSTHRFVLLGHPPLSGDLSASVEAKRNLEREILKMWRSHPTGDVNNLVASFRRRLKAVVDLKGEYTKY